MAAVSSSTLAAMKAGPPPGTSRLHQRSMPWYLFVGGQVRVATVPSRAREGVKQARESLVDVHVLPTHHPQQQQQQQQQQETHQKWPTGPTNEAPNSAVNTPRRQSMLSSACRAAAAGGGAAFFLPRALAFAAAAWRSRCCCFSQRSKRCAAKSPEPHSSAEVAICVSTGLRSSCRS
jgi:hypothetical protein